MGIFRKTQRDQEKAEAKKVNREYKRQIDQWCRVVWESGKQYADAIHEEKVRRAQQQRIPYLMELCHVTRPEDIDYSRPDVKVCLMLCDPVKVRAIQNPKYRQRVYDEMDEEMWQWYSTETDENDPSRTVQDVVESKWQTSKEMMKYTVNTRKNSKNN